MFLFKPKKQEEPKAQVVSKANADLEIITKMNQEFASSLDLNETLNTALKVIIERINGFKNKFLIKLNKFKFFFVDISRKKAITDNKIIPSINMILATCVITSC